MEPAAKERTKRRSRRRVGKFYGERKKIRKTRLYGRLEGVYTIRKGGNAKNKRELVPRKRK